MKLCECGCGQPAPIAKYPNRRLGHVKGEPVRFIPGHNGRGKPKSDQHRQRLSAYASARPESHTRKLLEAAAKRKPTATGSSEIHSWLNRHFPKQGACDECGKVGKTDYSFQRHPEPHTHNRDDYRELCRSCHMERDIADGIRPSFQELQRLQMKKRRQAAA